MVPTPRAIMERMRCRLCNSGNVHAFPSEINVHFPGFTNLSKPSVWAFPYLRICLDCGFAESEITEPELWQLADGVNAASNG